MTHTIEIKSHLANLMSDAAKELAPGFGWGFKVAHERIKKIAERAIEINDTEILHQLELIGYISISETPDQP